MDSRVVRACIERGWAEPWFENPLKPDWLVCKLTAAGRQLIANAANKRTSLKISSKHSFRVKPLGYASGPSSAPEHARFIADPTLDNVRNARHSLHWLGGIGDDA